MNDQIIDCFKEEFNRFFTLLEQQMDLCPDDLWNQKAGGFIFWQQHLHTLSCTFLYSMPDGGFFESLPYKPGVLMLSEEPDFTLTKDEMRGWAQKAKSAAHEFIDRQTVSSLTGRHQLMSSLLKRELTNQSALIALIRHLCYHLGCCDTALRDRGLGGVY